MNKETEVPSQRPSTIHELAWRADMAEIEVQRRRDDLWNAQVKIARLEAELAAAHAECARLRSGGVATMRAVAIVNKFNRSEIAGLTEEVGMDKKFGVKNRAKAEEFLKQRCEAILASKRTGPERRQDEDAIKPFSVIYLDLDLFKEINDTCGHEAGDKVIHAVIACIKKTIRMPKDDIFRLGGDEFLIVLENNKCGIETAQRLNKNLSEVVVTIETAKGKRVDLRPTISQGVYAHDPLANGCDAATILNIADGAMYHAKGKPGGVVDPDGKKQGRIAFAKPCGETELVKISEPSCDNSKAADIGVQGVSPIPAGPKKPWVKTMLARAGKKLIELSK